MEGSITASSRFPTLQVGHARAIRGVQKAVMLAMHCETTKRKWVKRFSCQLPRFSCSKRMKRRRRKIVALNTFWRGYLLDQQLRLECSNDKYHVEIDFPKATRVIHDQVMRVTILVLKYIKQIFIIIKTKLTNVYNLQAINLRFCIYNKYLKKNLYIINFNYLKSIFKRNFKR